MAIVENFYNGDRARDIRELLNQNFANVAKYIPNDFLVLTSIERQNVTDDYKTHFKLVFDKEIQRVYRWSDIKRNWEQYLIYAWDEYARTEANTNSASAFAEVELGTTEAGTEDPYTFTFFSRAYTETNGATGASIFHPKQAKDSVSLTGANVKFNDDYSMQTITQKLIDDLKSLDDFVGNRDDILNNSNLTAKTVAGAVKEVNTKTIENKTRLDNIENGTTKVPEAIHAEHADLADIATLAKDSEMLGGQLPNYYAKQSDLTETEELLDDTINRVSTNETDILSLYGITTDTNTHLQEVDEREAGHYEEFVQVRNQVSKNSGDIGEINEQLDNMRNQIGWEILFA